MLSLALVQVSFAQGKGGSSGGGGGSSSGSDSGDQIQDRDQDRTQDPFTHDGDEPLQDRDQDRLQDADQDQDRDQDRVQDPSTHDGDEPDQDRTRDGQQVELEFEESYMPAHNITDLQNMMWVRHQELEDETEDYDMPMREIMQNQNQIRETVYTMLSAGPLVNGSNGEQVRTLAEQMQERMQEMVQTEYELQRQSRIYHMFFGGDDKNGQLLLQNCEQVREQVQEMNQYIDECSECGDQIRETLREQLRLTENECIRLEDVAQEEINSRGIFGFLFGWLR